METDKQVVREVSTRSKNILPILAIVLTLLLFVSGILYSISKNYIGENSDSNLQKDISENGEHFYSYDRFVSKPGIKGDKYEIYVVNLDTGEEKYVFDIESSDARYCAIGRANKISDTGHFIASCSTGSDYVYNSEGVVFEIDKDKLISSSIIGDDSMEILNYTFDPNAGLIYMFDTSNSLTVIDKEFNIRKSIVVPAEFNSGEGTSYITHGLRENGKELIFSQQVELFRSNFYLMDIDTGRVTKISEGNGDDKFIYIAGNDDRIYLDSLTEKNRYVSYNFDENNSELVAIDEELKLYIPADEIHQVRGISNDNKYLVGVYWVDKSYCEDGTDVDIDCNDQRREFRVYSLETGDRVATINGDEYNFDFSSVVEVGDKYVYFLGIEYVDDMNVYLYYRYDIETSTMEEL